MATRLSRIRGCGLSVRLAASGLLMIVVAGVLHAQSGGFGWGGWLDAGFGDGRYQREMVPAERRGFYGCWLAFDRNRTSWGKRGWDTDYPLAVRNFMTRLTEFTTTPVNGYPDGAMADGVVRATDDGLFQCPFLFTSDVGTAVFSTAEADRLREYLLKGGMLWADDFWGSEAMDHWSRELNKILPGYERVVLDRDHPVMSAFYFLEEVPQMPSYQSWSRGGGSEERRGMDTSVPTLSAILDEQGRALVVMSHNTDIGDGMEREGVDPTYFNLFSPRAYALAINVAIYGMTH